MNKFIENNFVWIVILFSAFALLEPNIFTWLKPYLPLLLSIIMLGIGINLELNEFKQAWQLRKKASLAIIAKYIVMPLSAYTIAKVCHLSNAALLGMVIIGTCPGGIAANLMSYLADANKAFTVILTFATTLISPVITPLLIYLLLRKHISIPFWGIFTQIILIVLIPIFVGLILKKVFKSSFSMFQKNVPSISVISIALIIACVVALSHQKLLSLGVFLVFAVTAFNLIGYCFGLFFGKFFSLALKEKKSLIFEFGIYDTGLAVVLASTFFGPSVALPAALLSVIQNITAPILVTKINKRARRLAQENSEVAH